MGRTNYGHFSLNLWAQDTCVAAVDANVAPMKLDSACLYHACTLAGNIGVRDELSCWGCGLWRWGFVLSVLRGLHLGGMRILACGSCKLPLLLLFNCLQKNISPWGTAYARAVISAARALCLICFGGAGVYTFLLACPVAPLLSCMYNQNFYVLSSCSLLQLSTPVPVCIHCFGYTRLSLYPKSSLRNLCFSCLTTEACNDQVTIAGLHTYPPTRK